MSRGHHPFSFSTCEHPLTRTQPLFQAFELLLHVNPPLPLFDRQNWTSTIRHLVKSHPDYVNLSQFVGPETADIVYPDISGAFTSFLIGKGYLNEKAWDGRKPQYLIEVKTTTGACHEPFYVSNNQYCQVCT
jgi:hypothetical protein